MKTVVIGASAHSTPALFDTAVRFEESMFSFTLVARNVERLAAVGRAVDVLGLSHGYRVRQERASMSNLETALVGADVVIVQIRTGGYASRNWDERFPHRYGLCGDEGLGVGGLAAAWRTWPELRAILARIASARPEALVLMLTSPVGILTRCALSAFPQLRLYGICELPWTTLVNLCGHDVTAACLARFAYVGINHVGWFSDVRSGGRALLGPSEVLPLKYAALGEEPGRILSEQLQRPSRAHQLEHIAAAAFRAYERGSPPEILAAVRRRATPWYAHAVAPFLEGISGVGHASTFFLTHRNASYCPWLADDDVIEMPFTLRSSYLRRGTLGTWSRYDIAARLMSLVRYEALAAEAVRTRDIKRLATAISKHPWLNGVRVDAALVQDVVAKPSTVGSNRRDVAVVQ